MTAPTRGFGLTRPRPFSASSIARARRRWSVSVFNVILTPEDTQREGDACEPWLAQALLAVELVHAHFRTREPVLARVVVDRPVEAEADRPRSGAVRAEVEHERAVLVERGVVRDGHRLLGLDVGPAGLERADHDPAVAVGDVLVQEVRAQRAL